MDWACTVASNITGLVTRNNMAQDSGGRAPIASSVLKLNQEDPKRPVAMEKPCYHPLHQPVSNWDK